MPTYGLYLSTLVHEFIGIYVRKLSKIIHIKIYQDENNLCIEFLDNGGGIKDEFINRVFEPYFTTKHKSQGTGVGLYMSLQIVTKHLNGEISVKNDTFIHNNIKYFGAKFTILIPIYLKK